MVQDQLPQRQSPKAQKKTTSQSTGTRSIAPIWPASHRSHTRLLNKRTPPSPLPPTPGSRPQLARHSEAFGLSSGRAVWSAFLRTVPPPRAQRPPNTVAPTPRGCPFLITLDVPQRKHYVVWKKTPHHIGGVPLGVPPAGIDNVQQPAAGRDLGRGPPRGARARAGPARPAWYYPAFTQEPYLRHGAGRVAKQIDQAESPEAAGPSGGASRYGDGLGER
jgi:hypothetical protein